MDWEQLRERTLGEVGTALATEGVGVSGGLIGASLVGRQIENIVMGRDPITPTKPYYVKATDTMTTKFKAWAANNIPKLGIWYLLRNYAKAEPGEMVTPGKEITIDAKKAFAGSVVFDTMVRVTNHGVPLGPVSFFGIDWLSGEQAQEQSQTTALQADMQRLIQENSALRSELNKALQRIASTPAPAALPPAPVVQTQVPTPSPAMVQPAMVQPYVQAAPPAQAPIVRYQPVQASPAPIVRQAQPIVQPTAPAVTYSEVRPPIPPAIPVRRVDEIPIAYSQPVPPAVSERERKYGFMQSDITPPAVQERERRYGFMKGSEEKDIATMFGML